MGKLKGDKKISLFFDAKNKFEDENKFEEEKLRDAMERWLNISEKEPLDFYKDPLPHFKRMKKTLKLQRDFIEQVHKIVYRIDSFTVNSNEIPIFISQETMLKERLSEIMELCSQRSLFDYF